MAEQENGKQPSEMAITPSPMSGVAPPVEHQIKPGEVRNPRGRPVAGMVIREWVNQFVSNGTLEPELVRIARDPQEPPAKRSAAVQVLQHFEMPDLADFEPYMRGQATLEELKSQGVNTRLIKKAKRRATNRKVQDGQVEEQVEAEVELHDRSGTAFDRVVNHTDGPPTQNVNLRAVVGNLPDEEMKQLLRALSPEERESLERIGAKLSGTLPEAGHGGGGQPSGVQPPSLADPGAGD